MKNLIVLLSLSFFLLSLVAIAQPRFTPQERLKMLKERLNLTEEQSKKVEDILVKSDKEIKKLRSSDNRDRTQFRDLMDKINQEIEKVLDEKQKAEYKKMMEERRQRPMQNNY
ncbi:MAG TPA: hypothetical protein PKD67_10950 [Ignavibacteriaceae bacterium]|nr:hypothetical protein [Ignavibacteriaceae bacterium]